jgi:lysophospholipase L1-like esterase
VGLNERLIEFCAYNGVEYIDIYPHMVADGKLDSTLTYDGIHLNGKGYGIWRKAIEKYVN